MKGFIGSYNQKSPERHYGAMVRSVDSWIRLLTLIPDAAIHWLCELGQITLPVSLSKDFRSISSSVK